MLFVEEVFDEGGWRGRSGGRVYSSGGTIDNIEIGLSEGVGFYGEELDVRLQWDGLKWGCL